MHSCLLQCLSLNANHHSVTYHEALRALCSYLLSTCSIQAMWRRRCDNPDMAPNSTPRSEISANMSTLSAWSVTPDGDAKIDLVEIIIANAKEEHMLHATSSSSSMQLAIFSFGKLSFIVCSSHGVYKNLAFCNLLTILCSVTKGKGPGCNLRAPLD